MRGGVLTGLLLLLGCSGPSVVISNVQATQSPANSLAYYVQWQTEPPAPSQLTVDCGPDYQQQFADTSVARDHRVFMMGLWSGASCAIGIDASLAGYDDADPYRDTIEAGPLPSYLPDITVQTPDSGTVQPGWTLVELSDFVSKEPLNVALIDSKGRFRWYDELNVSFVGSDTDTRVVSNGVLVGGTGQFMAPTIVDWQGNVVWNEPAINMHHDIRPDVTGENQLLFLSGTNDCPGGLLSGTVDLWDRDVGAKTWEWKTCDHYPAGIQTVDSWDHLNTVVPLAGGNTLLVSARNLDRVFEIDRASGDILWELGPDLGWTLTGDGWFYHQHAPELEDNGDILLFDNGLAGVREYSRAVEIAFDVGAKTAKIVWQFVPDPPIFAEVWGDADRLPNGNTLVTFGQFDSSKATHLIEVAPDSTEVWHISFPPAWGIYRAERVVDPPVGDVLSN